LSPTMSIWGRRTCRNSCPVERAIWGLWLVCRPAHHTPAAGQQGEWRLALNSCVSRIGAKGDTLLQGRRAAEQRPGPPHIPNIDLLLKASHPQGCRPCCGRLCPTARRGSDPFLPLYSRKHARARMHAPPYSRAGPRSCTRAHTHTHTHTHIHTHKHTRLLPRTLRATCRWLR
jgi:hypothetical protein